MNEIIANNTTVYFVDKMWFSQSLYAENGLIKGYCKRSKAYKIMTKHGYCSLNRNSFRLNK